MKALIVGYGSIGKRHLKNLVSIADKWNIDEIGVYDRDPTTYPTNGGGDDSLYISWLTNPPWNENWDAAIICTPPEYHWECSNLISAPYVLVEKPLDTKADWGGLARKKRLLRVAMNLRFHPGVNWLKDILYIAKSTSPVDTTLAHAWYSYHGSLKRTDSPDAKLPPVYASIHDLDALIFALGFPLPRSRLPLISVAHKKWTQLLFQTNWGKNPSETVVLTADYLSPVRRRGARVLTNSHEYMWEAQGKDPEVITQSVDGVKVVSERYNLNDMYVEELEVFLGMCRGDAKKDKVLPKVTEIVDLAKRMMGE